MYCIGLTGTIASGKSTIAWYFKNFGIDVINADAIAKSLVEPDKPALKKIINHFGNSILTSDGKLNRPDLRKLILQNQTDRLWLENLLHPLIREQITIEYAKCKSPYCIIEIPLLTNKSDYPYLNSVILVKSTQEQQIKRIIERDNVSQTEAEAILATTNLHEEKRLAIADHILINDGSIEDLKHQITLLHQELVSDPSHRASGL